MSPSLPLGRVFLDHDGSDKKFPGFLLVNHGRDETADAKALAWAYAQMTLQGIGFGLKNLDVLETAFPALYLARHTLELYLKGLVPDWDTLRDKKATKAHSIGYLVDILKERLDRDYDRGEVEILSEFLRQFAMLSPQSMEFRYRDGAVRSLGNSPLDDPEIWVDFVALKESLTAIFEALDKVWRDQRSEAS